MVPGHPMKRIIQFVDDAVGIGLNRLRGKGKKGSRAQRTDISKGSIKRRIIVPNGPRLRIPKGERRRVDRDIVKKSRVRSKALAQAHRRP